MTKQTVREYIKIYQLDTLEEIVNKVPERIHYKHLYFEYEAYIANDGNPYCAVSLYYDRPETVEETLEREELAKRRLQLDVEHDKRQLKYLYEKYGKPE